MCMLHINTFQNAMNVTKMIVFINHKNNLSSTMKDISYYRDAAAEAASFRISSSSSKRRGMFSTKNTILKLIAYQT